MTVGAFQESMVRRSQTAATTLWIFLRQIRVEVREVLELGEAFEDVLLLD